MSERDLHRTPFDDGTMAKLDLYREYLRAWLPTFIHTPGIKTLNIFDFFAGPGQDCDGKPGSPLVALDEIQTALNLKTVADKPRINLYFNEYNRDKTEALKRLLATDDFILPNVAVTIICKKFEEAFAAWIPIMTGPGANLLFLDQNGVKQVTQPVFQKVVGLPRTDFLFFISSATVNRFKEQPEIRKCVPIMDADFARMNGSNVHRILAEAYRRWLPAKIRYYIAPFSIRKNSNVYGLVFGSGHVLGIDKFLQVAWKMGGDANFDIDDDGIDPSQPSLFATMDTPKKISQYEKLLRKMILDGWVSTNQRIYEFTLEQGMLPRHARDVIKSMIANGDLPKQTIHVSYESCYKQNSTEKIILKGSTNEHHL